MLSKKNDIWGFKSFQTKKIEAGVHGTPRAHTRAQTNDLAVFFLPKVPMRGHPEAILDVTSDKNIGHTDKLSRSR